VGQDFDLVRACAVPSDANYIGSHRLSALLHAQNNISCAAHFTHAMISELHESGHRSRDSVEPSLAKSEARVRTALSSVGNP